MDNLRLYLLLIGVVILLVIYYQGRKKQEDKARDIFADHNEQDDVLLGSETDEPEVELPEQEVLAIAPEAEPQGRIDPQFVDEFSDTTEENIPLAGEPVELTDKVEPISEAWEQDSYDEQLEEKALIGSKEAEVEATAENPVVAQPEAQEIAEHDYVEAAPIVAAEPVVKPEPEPEPVIEPEPEPAPAPPPQEDVVVMYVVAPEKSSFQGEKIFRAFRVRKLRFGDMDLFHRQERSDGQLNTLFSIASMLKPGTLKPAEIRKMELKGLSMFMRVAQVGDPSAAYDDMLATAQNLAADLGGMVCDNQLQPLSQQTINHIRARLSA